MANGSISCIVSSTLAGTIKWTYPDALVELKFRVVVFLGVKGVETDLVMLHLRHDLYISVLQWVGKGGSHPLLELGALLQRQGIRLRDNWHHVDNLGKLLQDGNINLRVSSAPEVALQRGKRRTGLSVCPVGLMKKTQQ